MQLAPEILPGSCGVSAGSHDTSQVLGIVMSTFRSFPSHIHRVPRVLPRLGGQPRAVNLGPCSYVIATDSITELGPTLTPSPNT